MTTYLILPERKNSFRKYARSVERDCRERELLERGGILEVKKETGERELLERGGILEV